MTVRQLQPRPEPTARQCMSPGAECAACLPALEEQPASAGGAACTRCTPPGLQGTHLASGAGDSTVKLWSFEKQKCVATYSDHTQAVWGVAFHDSGNFVASCSLDHSVRLWDVTTGKCRQSMRWVAACFSEPARWCMRRWDVTLAGASRAQVDTQRIFAAARAT